MKSILWLIFVNILVFTTLMIAGNIIMYVILPMFEIDISQSVRSQYFFWPVIFGFGGAFISLFMSKYLAKRMYKMQQITSPSTDKEKLVFSTVAELSMRAKIKMPEVWVYWDDAPNAFATGPTRNRAMVAVSSGLVMNLSDKDVKAVLAHEIGHVSSGDMLTTTLLQGLMNTLVMIVARFLARIASTAITRSSEPSPFIYMAVYIVIQILLSILASIVVFWFSRRREFKADAYASRVYGPTAMINALERLHAVSDQSASPVEQPKELAAMKIYSAQGGVRGLFATHPPVEARIKALQRLRDKK